MFTAPGGDALWGCRLLQHHHGGGAAFDVWPWRGSSIGPRRARSSIRTVEPPRGCSTGWFRYAPKGARFPAGPRSLRRALSPQDRWETRQLRPCRKVSESISLGHSEEPPTVSLPKERLRVPTAKVGPGPTGHTRRCAAGCHVHDSERAGPPHALAFPEGNARREAPKGTVGVDAQAASRRTPSFCVGSVLP